MTIDQKVRALLRKTVAAGCTPAEQESATALARTIIKKHGLREADFTWPTPPAKAAPRAAKAREPHKAPPRAAKAATKPAKRPTRGDEVVELLRRKNGATIDEMVTRFGLQPHSIRAVISVESRKRGLTVELVGKAHYRVVA